MNTLKRQYESPSTEAVRFAEEPKRGFVFSSSYMKGEKIVTGANHLLSNVAQSSGNAAMNNTNPYTKGS